jgi:hypothetical protein
MSSLLLAVFALGSHSMNLPNKPVPVFSNVPTPVNNVFSGGFDPIIGLPTGTTLVETWASWSLRPATATNVTIPIGIGSQGNWTGESQNYKLWVRKVASKAYGYTPQTVPFSPDEWVAASTTAPSNPGASEYAFARWIDPTSTYPVNPPVVRGRNINLTFANLSGEAVWLHLERVSYPGSDQAWDLCILIN